MPQHCATRMRALHALLALVAMLAASACTAATSAAAAATPSPSPSSSRVSLFGSCTNIPTPFMNDVSLAYTVARPDVRLEQEVLLSAAAQAKQFANGTDFSVVSAVLSEAVERANPDTLLLPLFTYALVPVYNLPTSGIDGDGGAGVQLLLSRSVLARIFLGAITRWDDSAIVALNPSIPMPDANITVVYTLSASGQQWAAALALFDTEFATAIGNTRSPSWPTRRWAHAVQVDTLVRTTATVAQTPYSISWSTFDIASAGGVPMAAMINSVGNTVVAGSSSLSYATQTVAAGPNAIAVQLSASLALTLSNSAGSEAWPMAYYAYVMVSRSTHSKGSTCAAKRALVDFLYWMYTSAAAARIATEHGLTMLPTLLFDQLRLSEWLSGLRCDGAPVYAKPSLLQGASSSVISGNSGVQKLLNVQLTAYARISATSVYDFTRSQAAKAWSQLDSGAADAIVVAPDLLRAQRLWPTDDAYLSLPMYLLAASPVASLPASVSARWSAADPALKAQYPLLPLRLDLDTLSLIFGGDVSSWLDPRLTALNPYLPYWFAHDDPRLTIVVCCSDSSDPQLITSHFLYRLSQVRHFQQLTGLDPSSPFPTRPFDLFPRARPETASNWIVVPTEDQLSYVTTLRLGSFSYALSQDGLLDPQSPIQTIQVIPPGAAVPATAVALQPTSSSMLACIQGELAHVANSKYDLFDVRSTGRARQSLAGMALTQSRTAGDTYPEGCYPFTQLVSLTVPNRFAPTNATNGGNLLRMLEWLNSDSNPSLSLSTTQLGGVHLPSALPTLQRANQAAIAGATVDGQSLLYQTPPDHLFDQQSLSVELSAVGTFLSYLLAVIGAFVGFLLLEDPLFHAKTHKSTRRDLFNVVSAAFVWSVAAVWPTFVLAADALSVQASRLTFTPAFILTCWLPCWLSLAAALSIKMRSFGHLPDLFANRRARADGSMITSTNSLSPSPSPPNKTEAGKGKGPTVVIVDADADVDNDDPQVIHTHEVHPVRVQLLHMLRACRLTDVWSLLASVLFVVGLVSVDLMGVASLDLHAQMHFDAAWIGCGVGASLVLAWLALQLVFHLDMMQWTSSFFVALPIFVAHHFALRSISFTYDRETAAAYESSGWNGTTLTLVSILLAAACCFVLIAVQFYRSKITSQGWLRQVVALRRDKRQLNKQLRGAQQKAQLATDRADQAHIHQHLVSLLLPNNHAHLAIYAWSLAQGSNSSVTHAGMGDLGSTRGMGIPSGFGPPSKMLAPPGLVVDTGSGVNGAGGGGSEVVVATPPHLDSPANYRVRTPVQWPRVPTNCHLRSDSSRRDDSAIQMLTTGGGHGGSSTPVHGTTTKVIAPPSPSPSPSPKATSCPAATPLLKSPDAEDFHRTLEFLQTSLAVPMSDVTSIVPLPELDDVLSHSVGIELFRAALRAQVSEENLIFYLYVRVYEAEAEASVRRELALDIYRMFVVKQAAHELNLPSHVAHDIQTRVEQQRFERNMFAAAKQEIYTLMHTNTWCKFRASTDYQFMCAILQK